MYVYEQPLLVGLVLCLVIVSQGVRSKGQLRGGSPMMTIRLEIVFGRRIGEKLNYTYLSILFMTKYKPMKVNCITETLSITVTI